MGAMPIALHEPWTFLKPSPDSILKGLQPHTCNGLASSAVQTETKLITAAGHIVVVLVCVRSRAPQDMALTRRDTRKALQVHLSKISTLEM